MAVTFRRRNSRLSLRRRRVLRSRMSPQRLSVLIVDENADDRRLLLDHLHSLPQMEISVRECASGLEALEVLRKQRIDAVLADRLLPDMSGVELVSQICELADDTAIILTSRTDGGADAAAAMKSGARDFLLKREITGASLHACLMEALRSARLEWQVGRESRRRTRVTKRLGEFVRSNSTRLEDANSAAVGSLEKVKRSPTQSKPLESLAAHFAHVENSLRESRRFLAELTRMCEKADGMETR